jgi:hypothetical protein
MYNVKLIGSLDHLYPLDHTIHYSPPKLWLDKGTTWGRGVYANVSCPKVREMGILKCTECCLPGCTASENEHQNKERNGKP